MSIACFYWHCSKLEDVYSPQFTNNALDKYLWGVYNERGNGEISEVIPMEENRQCPCHKTKVRTPEEMRALMNRLSRIEGQIRGIRGMLEKDAYCADILTQTAAVNAAINAFGRELLGSHIRSCVAQDIRDGKDETIDELLGILQKMMK